MGKSEYHNFLFLSNEQWKGYSDSKLVKKEVKESSQGYLQVCSKKVSKEVYVGILCEFKFQEAFKPA